MWLFVFILMFCMVEDDYKHLYHHVEHLPISDGPQKFFSFMVDTFGLLFLSNFTKAIALRKFGKGIENSKGAYILGNLWLVSNVLIQVIIQLHGLHSHDFEIYRLGATTTIWSIVIYYYL